MVPISTENMIFTGICVLLCAYIVSSAIRTYRRTQHTGNTEYIFYSICCALFVWTFCSIFLFTAPTQEQAARQSFSRYIGVAFTPPLFCLHVRRHVTDKPLPRLQLVLTLIIPVITSIIVLSGDPFKLLVRAYHFDPPPSRFFTAEYGPWFYVHSLFSYTTIVYSYSLLLRSFNLLPRHVRYPVTLMILGFTSSSVANILVLFDIVPFTLDLTIIGTCLTLVFTEMSLRAVGARHVVLASRDNIFHNLSIAVIVLDRDRRIIDMNRTGKEKGALMPPSSYLEPYAVYMDKWLETAHGRISALNASVLTFEKDSGELHFNINEKTIYADGAVRGYLVEVTEITHLYTLFRHLEESANFDHLTGLYNRNAYIHKVKHLDADGGLPLLVMLGDVNLLKVVNDTKGHLAGDALLQRIALLLREVAPMGSFLARIGGDEFVLLVPQGSLMLGAQLCTQIAAACKTATTDTFGTPSISIGYALLTSLEEDYNQVIDEADRMMYEAKRKNRNGIRYRAGARDVDDVTPLDTNPTEKSEESARDHKANELA